MSLPPLTLDAALGLRETVFVREEGGTVDELADYAVATSRTLLGRLVGWYRPVEEV